MTPRAQEEWRRRVAAEYRSAAITAQLLHWGILAAFPESLLHVALRVVRDELDHAALSHECLVALGGGDLPVPMDLANLSVPSTAGILGGLVDGVLTHLCLGETLAVPLFDAMRRGATHPAVRPVLHRVLQDEAIHRQFGWDALDELLAHGEPVRERIRLRLPDALEGLRLAYAPDESAEPLTPEERGAGLLDHEDYRRVFWETLASDLGPRLQRRGFEVPEASALTAR